MDILVFEVAERRFGLPAELLQEVVAIPAITPLPKAPAIVAGVVNVHGVVVPVLDVRRRFGLPARPTTLDQHLIIAHTVTRPVALQVDRALELVTVEGGAIGSPEGIQPDVEYVAGIVRLPDGLLIIHDLERFLSVEESRAVAGALAGAVPRGSEGAEGSTE
jgi:purine-binding chemotaxis protein CheW